MSPQVSHPNFPQDLNITPLILDTDENTSFNADAQKRAIQRFGIAGRIWEAAELITRYFHLSEPSDWRLDPPCSIIRRKQGDELTVIELGSGTGYVGLYLAEQLLRLGKRKDLIVLTDLPDVCTLLEETLHHEKQRWMASYHTSGTSFFPVEVLPLPWGDATAAEQLSVLLCNELDLTAKPRHLTHILSSDLVYFPHLLAPLLRTLLQLTSPPLSIPKQSPEVIISYKIRSLSKETTFWSAFGLWFTFSPVLVCHGVARESNGPSIRAEQEFPEALGWHVLGSESFVFVGLRRPESFEWTVPESDSDLLAGVGARCSDMPQSDDTFETLLMMQMDA